MILKELIELLEQEPADKKVQFGFARPHSYRGFYEQLAFEQEENTTVGEMLQAAKDALGRTFGGWKGGEFTMHEYTDVWLAAVGCCGESIGPILLAYMLNTPDAAAIRAAEDAERGADIADIETILNGHRNNYKIRLDEGRDSEAGQSLVAIRTCAQILKAIRARGTAQEHNPRKDTATPTQGS